jgi:hypothetical protein
VLVRFSQYNIWEIRNTDPDSIIAYYRKGIIVPDSEIKDVHHDDRDYRLWKTYFNNELDHMPEAFPMIFYAIEEGYEIIKRIQDSKYVFKRLR